MASATREKVYERIAQLALIDVPQRQIAQAVQLSEAMISDIVNHDEKFKEILAEKSIAHHEEQRIVNEGWDAVEALSIKGIVDTLAQTHDPEFLLKAAAVANKAQRRGKLNQAIPTNGDAGRVVINLNGAFVDKLQQNNVQINVGERPELVQKDSDALSAKHLKTMLADSKMQAKDAEEVANGLGDIELTQDELASLDGEDGVIDAEV